jgi:hypothetical protein
MANRKRVKVVSSAGSVVGLSWLALKELVTIATMPEDLQGIWRVLVAYPTVVPSLILIASVASFLWAFLWPGKEQEAMEELKAESSAAGSVSVSGDNNGLINTGTMHVGEPPVTLDEEQHDWVVHQIEESGFRGARIDVFAGNRAARAADDLVRFLRMRGVPNVQRSSAQAVRIGGVRNGPISFFASASFGPQSMKPPPRIVISLEAT